MKTTKATPTEVLSLASQLRWVRDKCAMLKFIYDDNVTRDRGLVTVGLLCNEMEWSNGKAYAEVCRLATFGVLQTTPPGEGSSVRGRPVQLLFDFERKLSGLLADGKNPRDAYVLDALAADPYLYDALHTLVLVGSHGKITTSELASFQNVTLVAAQNKLYKLMKQGVVQKHPNGKGRSVDWTLPGQHVVQPKRAGKIKTNVHPLMTRAWV